ncbi:DHA2 family efflux MFS transporter permease subunit [Rhizobium sp. CECT 9324]|uniref:DHA2 family efflux MFS transporter permease subunit n=1 Tax=Rhizobium sp. CECT 9324 TaxID=2845820 RepID=UPI000DDD7EA2|nr:DHA2 family efflux MFS transporter permease subunit [Rhizobium sp. CECT 9324]CAH0341867.1 Colistin resistance protein EmrB [Rhizobium sp. CECT 9324]
MAVASTASPTLGSASGAEERMDPKRVIAFLAMVFGMFMSILDIQIVSASLSEIQAGLGASNDEVAWVQTSYLIAEVIMIPLSGVLARILSTRVLFSICAGGFTLASALAATATNIEQMIVYRAIQGFIGGGMIPSVFVAAFTIFPPSKRNIVSPMIGLVATLAPTIGPTIGGYISHALSWHWLFLINVIPGIIVAATTWSLIDFDEPDHSLMKKFDWWGLASMAVFLGSMEFVLEEGNNKDWFNDHHIVMGTIAMVIGGAIFFRRVFKVELPVVDLRAFSNANFAFGSLFSFVMGVGLYGLTYLYPLYLSRIRHYDSLMIGETMFVSGAAMFLTAPIAGILSSKLDPRVMMMLGFAGFATGTYMMTGITADWDFYELLLPQILRGCSLMICMVPINNIALGTLPPDRMKNASGLFNLTRNLGGAVGLAIINTMITQRTDDHFARLSEQLDWGNAAALDWLASVGANYEAYGLDGSTVAVQKLAGIVTQQATLLSFIDIFMALTVLFGSLVFMTLMLKKPKAAAPAGAGH